MLARRLTYIMLVRVILYTLLLGGTVGLHFAWGRPGQLGGPYITVLFVFIATVYVLNILYALLMWMMPRLTLLAMIQIAVDLITSALLIHFTGGANSPFMLFILLSPIAAPLVFTRRLALITAVTGSALLCGVVVLGYVAVLPVLPGQTTLPSAISLTEMIRSILVHGGAMVAMALLVSYLAEQASQQVQQQREQIDDLSHLNEDIIRCLTSGLVTIDGHGHVLTLNQTAADILGLDVKKARGQPLGEIAPELVPVDLPKEQQRSEVALQRGSKELILGVSTSPLTDRLQRSVGRIISFQDLTTLRQMEATMKRSEHLASIGRLAAGIAHEIRNPLASISGSLELLRGEDESAENRKLMGIALKEIERLDGLIVDLLDFARPREPELEPTDLGREIVQMVEGIGELVAKKDAPSVNVNVSQDQALWVDMDRDQMRGVLWNLVRNASQAGEIDRIDVKVSADADHVFLEVSDRGAGIPPEAIDHIYEPFFTTKTKGSGLGLAFVLRAVQDHRGKITVQSNLDEGTCFRIALPRIPAPTR